jgi:oligopeptide transport system substrate-binding protein
VHALEANGGMLDRTGSWTRPGKAVGNGPFTITDHRFNHYLEVRRNPRYRQADKVSLNGIRFLPTVNGFTETRMYFNGKIHITNNVPSEMNEYARRRGGKEFCQDDYYVTVFYRLNTTRYPLNDQRVRQALSFAVDREALVQQVVCGGGHPCFAFTPDGAGYHPPHTVTFDPEKARRLLAEAGFPQGKGFPHLELMTSSREVQRTMAEAIQGMWKKYLGIHVDIRSCEWTAYKFAQNTMQYDFSSSSWSGDYLDPSSFLELWGKASGNNNTGWTHPEYERLLEQSRHCGSQSERMELLAEAEQIMLAESPVIPLYWSKRSYLKRPEVRGWFPLLLDNHLFESVRFDRESNDNREDRP